MNEMYPCKNRNAGPNNNQLITYYEQVSYLPREQSTEIILTIHNLRMARQGMEIKKIYRMVRE